MALLASSNDRLNLSRSPCCRASLAKSVCFCALAPRGAPRLLAPDTTPKQSHFESRRVRAVATCQAAGVFSAPETWKISFDLWLTIVFILLL